jgi:hypothetical protein
VIDLPKFGQRLPWQLHRDCRRFNLQYLALRGSWREYFDKRAKLHTAAQRVAYLNGRAQTALQFLANRSKGEGWGQARKKPYHAIIHRGRRSNVKGGQCAGSNPAPLTSKTYLCGNTTSIGLLTCQSQPSRLNENLTCVLTRVVSYWANDRYPFSEKKLLRPSSDSERGSLVFIAESNCDNEILGMHLKGVLNIDCYAGTPSSINGHSHPSNQIKKGPSIVFGQDFRES